MRCASDRMIKGLSRGDVWDELLQIGLASRSVRHAMSDRIAVESSLLRRQTQMDIQSYMHGVGREARKASRASSAMPTRRRKDRALLAMAAAIDREAATPAGCEPARPRCRALARVSARYGRPAGAGPTRVSPPWRRACARSSQLPDPVGEINGLKYRPSGIRSVACACRSA